MTPEQIAELQERADRLEAENNTLKTKETEFSEAEQRLAEREKALLRTELVGTVGALVDAGKVLPAEKDRMVDFCMSLDDGDTVVEFGEGDDKQELSARAFFLQHLEGLEKRVDFSEHSRDDKSGNQASDLSDREIAQRAISYQEEQKQKGITISVGQAVDAVREGKAG